MRRITKTLLEACGACEEAVDTFLKLWPRGVVPSLKVIRQIQAAGLSLGWLAEHVLTQEECRAYNSAMSPARKVYHEALAPARKVFDDKVNPVRTTHYAALEASNSAAASEEHDSRRTAAVEAYNKGYEAACKAYRKAQKPAWDALAEAEPKALWKALKESK